MIDPESACTVDFNVDDTATSMLAFLARIRQATAVIDAGVPLPVPTIHMGRVRYLGPDAAAILAAIALHADKQRQSLTVTLPIEPPKLKAFCAFCGLSQFFQGGPAPTPDHPECETVPLTSMNRGPGLESERIVRLIRRHAPFEDEEAEYLRIGFSEVIQNVFDHAQSPIGAVYCARYFASKAEIRVAVVDRGRTIPDALAKTYPSLASSQAALRAVFEGGYSTKSRANNMGLGIRNLRDMVSHRRGRLVILSKDAIAEFHHSDGLRVKGPHGLHFQGTGVFFTMRTGVPE